MAVLSYGLIQRSRSLVITPITFAVVGVITVVYSALKGLGPVILIGSTGLVLLMDIRHPLTDFDRLMLDWSSAGNMPMHILLTKADKLAFGAAKNALLKVRQEIRKGWGEGVSIQLFSAPKRQGVEEAHAVLAHWLQLDQEEDEAEQA